jgi:hypothetical protein
MNGRSESGKQKTAGGTSAGGHESAHYTRWQPLNDSYRARAVSIAGLGLKCRNSAVTKP